MAGAQAALGELRVPSSPSADQQFRICDTGTAAIRALRSGDDTDSSTGVFRALLPDAATSYTDRLGSPLTRVSRR